VFLLRNIVVFFASLVLISCRYNESKEINKNESINNNDNYVSFNVALNNIHENTQNKKFAVLFYRVNDDQCFYFNRVFLFMEDISTEEKTHLFKLPTGTYVSKILINNVNKYSPVYAAFSISNGSKFFLGSFIVGQNVIEWKAPRNDLRYQGAYFSSHRLVESESASDKICTP
jgi:hypothetical protein